MLPSREAFWNAMNSSAPGALFVIQSDPLATIRTSFIIAAASGGIGVEPLNSAMSSDMAIECSSHDKPSIVFVCPVGLTVKSTPAAAGWDGVTVAPGVITVAVLVAACRIVICFVSRSVIDEIICP